MQRRQHHPVGSDDPLPALRPARPGARGVDRLEVCMGQATGSIIGRLPGNPPRMVVDDTFVSRPPPERFASRRAARWPGC